MFSLEIVIIRIDQQLFISVIYNRAKILISSSLVFRCEKTQMCVLFSDILRQSVLTNYQYPPKIPKAYSEQMYW